MYKLPKNITGIDSDLTVSLENFKELCYSLHGLKLISVLKIEGYQYPNNYYAAHVSDSKDEFYIYINCFVSVIAFGVIANESEIYFEKPELTDAILSMGFAGTVVSPIDMKSEVTLQTLTNLSSTETKAISRWLPTTIGKILFSSYFD